MQDRVTGDEHPGSRGSGGNDAPATAALRPRLPSHGGRFRHSPGPRAGPARGWLNVQARRDRQLRRLRGRCGGHLDQPSAGPSIELAGSAQGADITSYAVPINQALTIARQLKH